MQSGDIVRYAKINTLKHQEDYEFYKDRLGLVLETYEDSAFRNIILVRWIGHDGELVEYSSNLEVVSEVE